MKHFILCFLTIVSMISFAQRIDSAATSAKVFQVVEQMPEYPGGDEAMMKFIQKNIQYPDFERSNDIQGRVVVGFVINEDGAISDVSVKKGVSHGLDSEAMRVVDLFPKFKPGRQQGKDVKVAFVLPIMFKLANDSTSNNSSHTGKVYQVADKMPQYPGGDDAMMEFLENNIRYPHADRENNISGRVVLGFVVNEDGSVSDIAVKKSVSPTIDNEAIRVVKLMPRFSPGMQNAKPVRVAYVLPVSFKLRGNSSGKGNNYIDSLERYKTTKDAKAQYDKALQIFKRNDAYTACTYLKLAADRHYIPALMMTGYVYDHGTNGVQSYDSSFRYYLEAADSGDDDAQLQVGYMYEKGLGVDTDMVKSVKWYKRSADQNNKIAMSNLGLCYMNGRGVNKNDSLVKYYFRKSAELGYARAQFEMGIMYNYGRYGLTPDTDQALMWYDMAAQQHHPIALNNYAWLCYLKKVNITRALRYSKESMDKDPTKMYSLDTYAALLFVQGDYAEAKKWQKKVVDSDADIKGIYLERYGDILSKLNENEEALKYWKKAMEMSDHSVLLADKISSGKYLE